MLSITALLILLAVSPPTKLPTHERDLMKCRAFAESDTMDCLNALPSPKSSPQTRLKALLNCSAGWSDALTRCIITHVNGAE